jgi:hypothetical protein
VGDFTAVVKVGCTTTRTGEGGALLAENGKVESSVADAGFLKELRKYSANVRVSPSVIDASKCLFEDMGDSNVPCVGFGFLVGALG